MRSGRSLCTIFVVTALCASSVPARAGEPVVANQLYDMGGKFEVALSPVSMSIVDKYTRHFGFSLGFNYFFNDYLGLELDAGYNYINGDRKLLNEILRTAQTLDKIHKLPLTDLKHMTWFANLGLVFSPLYGKLDFSSEFAVSIHLYFVAGAGVAQYQYTELEDDPDNPEFGTFKKVTKTYSGGLTDAAVQPTFHFGGGLRFHVAESWGIKIEIRDVFFYDKYEADWKPAGINVQQKTIKDFVHVVFLRLGVCYTF